jgi:hypothetical protein
MRPPRGAFGIRWGTPLDEAARALNMSCEQSYDFGEHTGMQVCRGQTELFETRAWVEVVTREGAVAGFIVTFTNTPCEALDARVREELGVPKDIVPLATSWRTGEVVRLDETAAGCMLIVAGRVPGRELQRQQIAKAFRSFAGGLRP